MPDPREAMAEAMCAHFPMLPPLRAFELADAALEALTAELTTDGALDSMLEALSQRAGHPPNMTGLGLARWDLGAVLRSQLGVDDA